MINAQQIEDGGLQVVNVDAVLRDAVAEVVAASHTSPSRGLRRAERLERLKDALRDLKPEQREAIELAKIDGLKVREIAARMNRSEVAVKQLLSRGLRRMKKTFGDTESLHLPDQGLQPREVDNAE